MSMKFSVTGVVLVAEAMSSSDKCCSRCARGNSAVIASSGMTMFLGRGGLRQCSSCVKPLITESSGMLVVTFST